MKKLIFAVVAIFLIFKIWTSVKSDSDITSSNYKNFASPENSTFEADDYDPSSDNPAGIETYYKDSEYKYEYRTGTTGDYEYNYDINGSDEDGNDVYGNVDMNGKYGSGTVEDSDGNELDVDVEWVDYGVLEATDEDGNTYELHVDE